MLPIRIKACSESDLRMLGNLAHNIQRVLPVTQADIDAAAALGEGWVVWKVIEVNDPIDNLRGGTQLVIKQNSITPGQNVRRVLIVSGPGGETVVIGPGPSPLLLPDAIADSLSYVKAFGGTEQRNLPDNYIQRQFIYMMDGSYLLTDIVPTYDSRIEMDFQTTSLTTASTSFLGGRAGISPTGFVFGCNSSKELSVSAFSSSAYNSDYVFTDNTRYKMVFNNKVFNLTSGGSTVATYTFSGTNADGATLAINGRYDGPSGNVGGNSQGIYLYSFKVWNAQGELVADYVPAVQKGTVPVVGFYDTVSKTFKTATAGTFAAGGEAVPTPDTPMDIVSNNGVLKVKHQSGLPLGYTLLDSIASTGTQAINTGVKYTGNNFEIEWEAKDNDSSGQSTLFACVGVQPYSGGLYGNYGGRNYYIGTSSGFGLGYVSNDSQYHKWKIVVSGQDATLYKDGVQVGTDNFPGTINTTDEIYLFCGGKTSAVNPALTQFSKWGLKSWKFTDNGVVKFNAIPAKDSNNVLGMYDTVSGQFFTNQGTGDFVAGTAVSDPVEIYTDGTVETINVHGKNLFDSATKIDGYYINENGEIIKNASYSYSALIPVGQNAQYCLSGISNYNVATTKRLHAYDKDGNWLAQIASISAQPNISFSVVGTTTSATAYVRLSVRNTDTEIQLEQGSTATAYEPYFNGGTAVAEMLLKVGDYQDVQSILDGVITRNVGVKVLDGTENFGKSSQYAGSFFVRNVVSDWGTSNNAQVYCSHFSCVTAESSYVQNKCMILNNAFNMWWASDNTPTLAQFKQYLAEQYANGTPVIVIYPLATETTESVAGQTMQVQAGDNTLEITQASLNGLELEAEYQKSA